VRSWIQSGGALHLQFFLVEATHAAGYSAGARSSNRICSIDVGSCGTDSNFAGPGYGARASVGIADCGDCPGDEGIEGSGGPISPAVD